jgi:Ulp1 protease family, C-terminal catalytic domain
VRTRVHAYARLATWLKSPTHWQVPASARPIPFFQELADETEKTKGALVTEEMRNTLIANFNCVALSTSVALLSRVQTNRAVRLEVESIIDHIGNEVMLNDCIMNFVLAHISYGKDEVYCVDSVWLDRQDILPTKHMSSVTKVVFPLHYALHWCLIVATVGGSDWTVYCYDPLVQSGNKKWMKRKWASWCRPLLERWQSRDGVDGQGTDPDRIRDVETPKQDDGYNCGVFVLIQAYMYIHEAWDMQEYDHLTKFELDVVRVRILWMIFNKSVFEENDEFYAAVMESKKTLEKFKTFIEDDADDEPKTKKVKK